MKISKSSFSLKGFSFAGLNVGIKNKELDFGIIYSEVPALSDAVFTQNRFPGAPVIIGREHIKTGKVQAIVVNSKNANVYTGKLGEKDALEMCQLTAKQLKIPNLKWVLPFSTGIIGKRLEMEKIRAGCNSLPNCLGTGKNALKFFAKSIMTSDAYPKWGVIKIGNATLVGVAKGAGMIEPNMATMLSYFLTDAQISKKELSKIFRSAMDQSFNVITVDGDMSTSDSAVIMANGLAGKVDLKLFKKSLNQLSLYLAKEIIRDGEGTTKIIELRVCNVKNLELAEKIGKTILNSLLVKTAIHGGDPNWGRIIMAIGKVKGNFNVDKIKIYSISLKNKKEEKILLNEILEEKLMNLKLKKLKKNFSKKNIILEVSIGNGNSKKVFWGNDLSIDYVKFNSSYST